MSQDNSSGYASSNSSDSSTSSTSEPLLKYRRVQASVVDILNGTFPTSTKGTTPLRPPDSVTCAHLHPSALFLGTQSGNLYILDHLGNLLLHIPAHTARINNISTDITGMRVATCSDDGKVMILSTQSTWSTPNLTASDVTSTTTPYGRPMLDVAIDPKHASKRERVFVSGSVDGRVRINTRGWFTSTESELHKGEGPVQCVKWEGSLIAWANDSGVKLYDYDRRKGISYIERPRPRMQSTRAFDVRTSCGCCMHWEIPEKKLLVGWGDCWMVVQILKKTVNSGTMNKSNKSSASNTEDTVRYAQIVAVHYTHDYVISGICNFGDHIALLAFVPPEELMEDESSDEDDYDARPLSNSSPTDTTFANPNSSSSSSSSFIRLRPSRPELRIVDRQTGEQLSEDMLPVYGFSKCSPRDYSLVSDQNFEISEDQEDDSSYVLPSLYIVTPKDIVVASPRNVEDHIKWALEHDQYDQALEIAEHAEPPLSKERLQNLAERYLAHLVHDGEFIQAAGLCPRLLQYDAEMWSRWVLVFAEHNQLLLIGAYVPTIECRLPPVTYEKILAAFIDETTRRSDSERSGKEASPTLMATIRCLELLFRWLPYQTVGATSYGTHGSSSSSSSHSSSSSSSSFSTTSAPLFDIDTIVRRILRLLPDISLKEAGVPVNERYITALLHLGIAYLYRAMGCYKESLERFLHPSLLNVDVLGDGKVSERKKSTISSSSEPENFSCEERGNLLLSHRLDVYKLIADQQMYDALVSIDRSFQKEEEENSMDGSVSNCGGPIAGLLRLDGAKALDLFVNAPQNADTTTKINSKNGLSIHEIANRLSNYPELQLRYLDGVWQHPRTKQIYNSNNFAELHKLQVKLYANYQRNGLRSFLQSSEHYDLRRAFVVCQNCKPTPMHQEMVYILSRLGNTKEALALIIEELEDVPQAIEFIKDSHDSSLWSELVEKSLKSPRFIAGLLGNIGTAVMMEKTQGVDPAQLISKIPLGMRVPGLRDKLVKIISDYTMQLQLRESCNLVLKADCFELLKKLCYQQTRAMRVIADPAELALQRRLHAAALDSSSINSDLINNVSGGGKRRSTSVSTEPEVFGSSSMDDSVAMQVPFSDKICYPGRQSGDRVHTTRQSSADGATGSGGGSSVNSSEMKNSGGNSLPKFR